MEVNLMAVANGDEPFCALNLRGQGWNLPIIPWPAAAGQTDDAGNRVTAVTDAHGRVLTLWRGKDCASIFEGRAQLAVPLDQAQALEAILTGAMPIAPGETIDLARVHIPARIDDPAELPA